MSRSIVSLYKQNTLVPFHTYPVSNAPSVGSRLTIDSDNRWQLGDGELYDVLEAHLVGVSDDGEKQYWSLVVRSVP